MDEQWKYADRINRDADESLKNNFCGIPEGVFQYFKNLLFFLLSAATRYCLILTAILLKAQFFHTIFSTTSFGRSSLWHWISTISEIVTLH